MLISVGKHFRQRNASSRSTGGCEHGMSDKEKGKYSRNEANKSGRMTRRGQRGS